MSGTTQFQEALEATASIIVRHFSDYISGRANFGI
jgi:hypothetical protein